MPSVEHKTSPKEVILLAAKQMIDAIYKNIETEHNFRKEDVRYEIVMVEDEKIILEISTRIKLLIEKQLKRMNPTKDRVSFSKVNKSRWEITVQKNDGIESYYFTALLQEVYVWLDKAKDSRISNEVSLLNEELLNVIREVNPKAKVKFKKPYYRKKIYYASIRICNSTYHMEKSTFKEIMAEIKTMIPTFLRDHDKKGCS